jgi:hypothetical protein
MARATLAKPGSPETGVGLTGVGPCPSSRSGSRFTKWSALDAAVPLREIQVAARHAEPGTTTVYVRRCFDVRLRRLIGARSTSKPSSTKSLVLTLIVAKIVAPAGAVTR